MAAAYTEPSPHLSAHVLLLSGCSVRLEGWIPGTTAACVRHVHCASTHRVSSVLLGLCAVGFGLESG